MKTRIYNIGRNVEYLMGKKIDQVLSEIAKLIIRLDKSSKKSRRDKNLVEKITEIRDLIQDAVLDAKLKKRLLPNKSDII